MSGIWIDEIKEQVEAEQRLGVPYFDRYSTQLQMRVQLCEFLNMRHWDKFVTITFRPELQTKDMFTASRRFKRFLERLKALGVTKGTDFFVAFERHQTGFLHIHCLLNGVSCVYDSDMWQLLFDMYGRARVEIFQRELGAEHYLTKYVTKEIHGWDMEFRKD